MIGLVTGYIKKQEYKGFNFKTYYINLIKYLNYLTLILITFNVILYFQTTILHHIFLMAINTSLIYIVTPLFSTKLILLNKLLIMFKILNLKIRGINSLIRISYLFQTLFLELIKKKFSLMKNPSKILTTTHLIITFKIYHILFKFIHHNLDIL